MSDSLPTSLLYISILLRKAGRRLFSVAPRVIVGQSDFLGQFGWLPLAGMFEVCARRELKFAPRTRITVKSGPGPELHTRAPRRVGGRVALGASESLAATIATVTSTTTALGGRSRQKVTDAAAALLSPRLDGDHSTWLLRWQGS